MERPRCRQGGPARRSAPAACLALALTAFWIGWMVPATASLFAPLRAGVSAGDVLASLARAGVAPAAGPSPLAVLSPRPCGCGRADQDPSRLSAALRAQGIEPLRLPRSPDSDGPTHPLILLDRDRRLVYAGPLAGTDLCGGSPALRARQLAGLLAAAGPAIVQSACPCPKE